MRKREGNKRAGAGHADRRAQLKVVLLLPPAIFWAGIFLALAGVSPLESLIESTPDAARVLIALGCPLLAVMLGVEAATRARRESGRNSSACWATVVAGVALFVLSAAVTLNHS